MPFEHESSCAGRGDSPGSMQHFSFEMEPKKFQPPNASKRFAPPADGRRFLPPDADTAASPMAEQATTAAEAAAAGDERVQC